MQNLSSFETKLIKTKMDQSTHSTSPAKQINLGGNVRIPHPNLHRDINRKQCAKCEIILIPKRNIPNSSFLNSTYVCTSCQTIRQRARNKIKRLNREITIMNLIKTKWAIILTKLMPKKICKKSLKQSHETISKQR